MDGIMAAAAFSHVRDLGSLGATARALGLSRPMVSRYLDEMEKWAGTRLIRRSSRRLTVTPAGGETLLKTRFLTQPSLDIGAASRAQILSDALRVACTHFTTIHILTPVLPLFMKQCPQLRIEVEISNQSANLVGERVDVAIRVAENPEPGTIACRLGDCRSVLCASTDYSRQHGTPETIDDLTRHNYLYYNSFAGQFWHLVDAQGQPASVAIKGSLSAEISSLLCKSAVSGAGIVLVLELKTQEGLAQGKLIRLLPEL